MTFSDGLLTAGLIVFGLFVTTVGIRSVRKATASRGWPMTMGTITGYRTTSSGSSSTLWAEYAYVVGGKEYRHAFFHTLGAEGEDEFKAQYPVGGQIEVAYRAEDPSQAETEEDRHANWLVVVFGVAALAAGLFFAARGLAGGPH